MCGFQARGQGFYYTHDSSTAKQIKHRSCNVVIIFVEGNATFCEIEHAFNIYLGSGWRCTAKPIGPFQYVMRFPNSKEVDKECFSDRMMLRNCGAVISLKPLFESVGAKGNMEVAWVNCGNIPLDKRTERNVAFLGSLLGVSLEIDTATLHRPESVRVKIGCRAVDDILIG